MHWDIMQINQLSNKYLHPFLVLKENVRLKELI